VPAESIGPEDQPAEVAGEGVGVWAGRLLALECTTIDRTERPLLGFYAVARRPEDRDKMYHDASYIESSFSTSVRRWSNRTLSSVSMCVLIDHLENPPLVPSCVSFLPLEQFPTHPRMHTTLHRPRPYPPLTMYQSIPPDPEQQESQEILLPKAQ
jgi:hypothetical protein